MKNKIKILARNGNTGFHKTFLSENASPSVEEVEELLREGGKETVIFSVCLETDDWGRVELIESERHGKVVTLANFS